MVVLTLYIFIEATVVGLLWMRKSKPDLDRPIKVNLLLIIISKKSLIQFIFKVNLFFPITFLIFCSIVIILSFTSSPSDSFLCIFVISIGLPIYILFIKVEKPKELKDKISKISFINFFLLIYVSYRLIYLFYYFR
jgi:hypothetical protein